MVQNDIHRTKRNLGMKLASHYIFLSREKSKKKSSYKKDDGTCVIVLPTGVQGYISKAFPDASPLLNRSIFKKIYNFKLCVSGIAYEIVISQYDVGKDAYLDIIVEGKTKAQIIKCFEYIEETLFNSGIEDDYICVISYDAVSEYYCNKIYPKLNTLERKLRRLLYNTYIVNFGLEYYEQTIITDVQNKTNAKIGKKGNKREKRNKEFFDNVDFGDIQRILFTATWNKYDEKQKQKFLNNNPDLSELSDEELRIKFSEFSPKSDWQRFFAHKIDDTIMVENTINDIREFRNQTAHCKHFSADDYKECVAAIRKLSRVIDQAIKMTEEQDFEKKNREMLQLSIEIIKNSFNEVTKSIRESIKPIIDYTRTIQFTNPFKGLLDDIRKNISNIALSNAATINLNPYFDNNTDDKEPEEKESEEKETENKGSNDNDLE